MALDIVRLEPAATELDTDSMAAVEVETADEKRRVDPHAVVLYLSCACGIHWQCDPDDHNNDRLLCVHALFLSWSSDLWSDLVAVAADADAAAGIDLVE